MMRSSGAAKQKANSLFNYEFGVGTWSWGDKLFWGYGKEYGDEDARMVFKECLNLGITFFDTAESYGSGESERLIGKFHSEADRPIFVATKFTPFPWRLSRSSLEIALSRSLKRLGLTRVDLYQIHWSPPLAQTDIWIEEMAKLLAKGTIGSIGISNYGIAQTENVINSLHKFGLQLGSNQVEYNLLNRSIEKDGLFSLCRKEGVRLIAYSPLAQGLLTGKYTVDNPPSGIRGVRYHNQLKTLPPLLALLRKLGNQYGGKTPAAIAINWVMCKGALPIPGAKTIQQLTQNAGALGWKLSERDITLLDEMTEPD